MKCVFLIITFVVLTLTLVKGQSRTQREQHDSISTIAKKYFEEKNFKAAALAYSNSFIALGNKGFANDRYSAAIAWSNCDVADSAFFQLNKLLKNTEFLDYQKLINSSDFNNLKSDDRWRNILNTLNPRNEIFNDSLASVLEEIHLNDQQYRKRINNVGSTFGWESKEFKELSAKINHYDTLNLKLVTIIIDKYGWQSKVQVGTTGNTTLWLVIQHADLSIQEKYFPIMQNAVKDGKASKKDLAYLQDRILMRQGKKQIYGTQYKVDKNGESTLWEVEDPANLNERRKAVGL